MTIARLSFTTETVITNLPEGREVGIATDADLTVQFWNPVAETYDAILDILAPGQIVFCPISRALLTAAGSANINITLVQ